MIILQQVRPNFRTAITIPVKSWPRFRDFMSDFIDQMDREYGETGATGGAEGEDRTSSEAERKEASPPATE